LVTLTVARRQFNANVLSVNRQKWIETLRASLAELISLLVSALVIKAGWKGTWDKGLNALLANPAMQEKLERLVLVQWNIRLQMNPTELDHQRLYKMIEATFARLQAEQSDDSATESDIEGIATLAQTILKREWQRVKRGL
jgi:hypothetical protein